jgi:hypothetical protein
MIQLPSQDPTPEECYIGNQAFNTSVWGTFMIQTITESLREDNYT